MEIILDGFISYYYFTNVCKRKYIGKVWTSYGLSAIILSSVK